MVEYQHEHAMDDKGIVIQDNLDNIGVAMVIDSVDGGSDVVDKAKVETMASEQGLFHKAIWALQLS